MDEPTFDIFRGTTEKDAQWVEAVPGFMKALQRVKEIANSKPGRYFVYEARRRSTIVQIDTGKRLLSVRQKTQSKIA